MSRRKVSIIGLAATGPGSGKDTLFDQLKAEGFEVVNIKFADLLTKQTAACFKGTFDHGVHPTDFIWLRNDPKAKDIPFHMFAIKRLTHLGYQRFLLDQGHDPSEPRSARWHLIEYGTSYRRKYLHQDSYWLDEGMQAARWAVTNGKIAIITDVRFPNEAQAVQAEGELVFVDAPWVDPAKGGVADGLIKPSDCDHIITNIWGNPETLKEQFNDIYQLA